MVIKNLLSGRREWKNCSPCFCGEQKACNQSRLPPGVYMANKPLLLSQCTVLQFFKHSLFISEGSTVLFCSMSRKLFVALSQCYYSNECIPVSKYGFNWVDRPLYRFYQIYLDFIKFTYREKNHHCFWQWYKLECSSFVAFIFPLIHKTNENQVLPK